MDLVQLVAVLCDRGSEQQSNVIHKQNINVCAVAGARERNKCSSLVNSATLRYRARTTDVRIVHVLPPIDYLCRDRNRVIHKVPTERGRGSEQWCSQNQTLS